VASLTGDFALQDEDSLLLQLDAIPECGTIIIISNLRRNGRQFELDFLANPHDIRISSDEPFEDDEQEGSQTFQQSRPAQPRGVDVPLDYSLRAYVNVLYKVPRMQIFIRNKKVRLLACVSACVFLTACVYVCVCLSTCPSVCVCMYPCACMCARVCVYVHLRV
jgi:hypothetical protein